MFVNATYRMLDLYRILLRIIRYVNTFSPWAKCTWA